MSNYPPDPGGVFASDHHRRVAAHLPLPGEETVSVSDLLGRLDSDPFTGLSSQTEGDVRGILDDLSESGDAKYLEGSEGWRLLKPGLEKLTGPALTEAQEVDGELKRTEPAPLEGPRLEEAEAQQQRIADEDEAVDPKAAKARVKAARAELKAAEEAEKEATDGR